MAKQMQRSLKYAMRNASRYSNGSEDKPKMKLDWRTRANASPFQEAAKSTKMRKVRVTLVPIPKSRVLDE